MGPVMSIMYALHNGGTGDEHITFAGTAVLLQHGIQDNDDHTVGCQNQEGGDTQYQDPFDDHGGPGRFPQPGYFDGNLFADQETESKGAGCKLCDDRGNGCTRHIHMQTEDKDRSRIMLVTAPISTVVIPTPGNP